ncbi:MAG TPA: putative ABC exporter domain-containing protein [Verrucomicrobiota bacterium]|nr:hypothetical protein [Verrucomicrobiales bacterium]HRI11393.1 putative ABC exporter domain-containing protein [Verrucomicrobiota bacterium]
MHLRSLILALVFLQTRSLFNALKVRVRRLKQPKYLIGAVVGLGWLYLWLGRALLGNFGSRRTPFELSESASTLIQSGAALVLLVFVAAQWIFTSSRAALQFSETELAFLLPAPLSRKMLIRYKLLRGQLGTLISALVLTIFTGRFAADGLVVFHVLGWWLVLTLLNLHSIGASFAVQRLTERGLSSWLRRLLAVGLFGGLVALAVVWVRMLPSLPSFADDPRVIAGELKDWAELALTTGPGPWLLLPFRWAVHPWFAASTGEFLQALVPVVALLAIHYWWVERSDVAFEEASLAHSEKRAQVMASARAGRQSGIQVPKKKVPAPFMLASLGWPPIGLMWKNLIAGRATPRKLAWFSAGVVILSLVARWGPWPQPAKVTLWGLSTMTFLAVALMGGTKVSSGLRQDLGMLDVLKVYPLPGWQIVLGEMLGPAIIISAAQGLLALAVVLTTASIGPNPPLEFSLVLSGAIGALLTVIPLNFVNAIIPSAATLLFPAWAKPGKDIQQPGFEAVGQRLLFGLAQLAALLLALAPAGAIAIGVFLLVQWLTVLELALIASGLCAGAVLAVEAGFGVRLLGRLFDGYDASSEQ